MPANAPGFLVEPLPNPERWPLPMSRFEVLLNFSYKLAYRSIAIEAGCTNSRNQQLYSTRDRLEYQSLQ
jgi:hypothetical protein